MQVAALVLLVAAHGVPEDLAYHLGAALPPLAVGGALGLALYGKGNDRMFRRAVLCALPASGAGFFAYR